MSAWFNPGDRLSVMALQDCAGRLGKTPRQWNLQRPVQMRAGAGGWLLANNAPVWVTKRGQPDDWVLQPGERLPLRPGQWFVAESWRADTAAELQWLPLTPPGPGSGTQLARSAVAAALRRATAASLGAVASALAMAAQGVEALAQRARRGRDDGAACPASCTVV